MATRSVPLLRSIGTHRCLKTSLAGRIFRTSVWNVDGVEVHDRHGELLADRFQHLPAGDEAQPNQDVVQTLAGAVLLGDGLGKLVVADQTPIDQDTADPHTRYCNSTSGRVRSSS